MPQVIPLVAAIAAGAATSFAVKAAIFIAAFALQMALTKKPKSRGFADIAQGLKTTVRSAVEPHKIIYGTAKVSGSIVLAETTNSAPRSDGSTGTGDNRFLHLVIPLAGHEVEEIGSVFLNDRELTLNPSGFATNSPYFKDGFGYVRVKKHLGSDTQIADNDLVSEVAIWESTGRLQGVAYIYIRLEYHRDIFGSGIPNVSAVVKGKKVFDPRTSLSAWSDNAALCIRDYLVNDYGFNADVADEINDTTFIAAANICDESISLAGGGTENRYTINGVVSTAEAPLDNLDELITAIAGAVTYTQGKFKCFAGAYDTPTVTVDESWLAGDITVQADTPKKELFNAVKGVFIDPTHDYEATDFPAITNSTYEVEDGGEQIFADIELPYTKTPSTAQRIAKLLLERSRQSIVVTMLLNHRALQFTAWDTILIDNAKYGWSAKPFRILSWSFAGEGIEVVTQEEAAASYSWNSGEETLTDPEPDTNLPDPFNQPVPGSPNITEELYSTIDGSGVKTRAIVSWSASTSIFPVEYQLEFKLSANADYIILPLTADTTFEINDIAPGSYDFRVKAVDINTGISSDYSSTTAEIFGLTALPADITGLSLSIIRDTAHLAWNQSPDLDVRVSGKIRIRFTEETVSPSWSAAVERWEFSGNAIAAPVPLKQGTYMVKAVDSTGNESSGAVTIQSSEADITKMNVVQTINEHTAFSGTKTNMSVSGGGVLSLAANGSVFETSGTCEFAGSSDFGKVVISNVKSQISAVVFDASDTFDDRAGLFDDAEGVFDGEELTGITVRFLMRTTKDDPTGSPTWSQWQQFTVIDVEAWGIEYKLEVESENEALNIDISELGVVVDMPDITDSGTVTTSAGLTTNVPFNKTFKTTTPFIAATILDQADGERVSIPAANIDDTGFDIDVLNAAGTRVAKTVHWKATGY